MHAARLPPFPRICSVHVIGQRSQKVEGSESEDTSRNNNIGFDEKKPKAATGRLSRGVLLELFLLERLSLRDRDFLIFPIFPLLLLLPPTGPLALPLFALPLPPVGVPMSPVLPPPVRRILARTERETPNTSCPSARPLVQERGSKQEWPLAAPMGGSSRDRLWG